jgi:hydrogenase maturation protease
MLVLCCGNPDRGDDAAGLLVARRLGELGVSAREHSGEALALIDAWRGADEVIIVDAVVTGKRRGTVSVFDVLTAPLAVRARSGGSHALGLAEAIALARAMKCLPRRLTLYGIEARRFDFAAPPSPAVLRGVAGAARLIHQYIYPAVASC